MKTNISAGTIARTLCLLLALVNQGLTITGHAILPIDDDTINQAVSLVFTVGASVTAWWKNNSFTNAAQAADKYMAALALKEETEK